jgi:hypothetical protein
MNQEPSLVCRHFVSYSGVKLPLKLVNELTEAGLNNRNTFYRGYFDTQGRLLVCQKIVYGEVESEHRYQYDGEGVLKHALIIEDDEERGLDFNERV